MPKQSLFNKLVWFSKYFALLPATLLVVCVLWHFGEREYCAYESRQFIRNSQPILASLETSAGVNSISMFVDQEFGCRVCVKYDVEDISIANRIEDSFPAAASLRRRPFFDYKIRSGDDFSVSFGPLDETIDDVIEWFFVFVFGIIAGSVIMAIGIARGNSRSQSSGGNRGEPSGEPELPITVSH